MLPITPPTAAAAIMMTIGWTANGRDVLIASAAVTTAPVYRHASAIIEKFPDLKTSPSASPVKISGTLPRKYFKK